MPLLLQFCGPRPLEVMMELVPGAGARFYSVVLRYSG